jgi:hypothetical protein
MYTSAECKTDISAVLTDTSGPDPHMIRTWISYCLSMEDGYSSMEVATSSDGFFFMEMMMVLMMEI